MRWVLRFIKEYNFKYWTANIMIILGSIISKVLAVILIGDIVEKGIYENDFSKIPVLFIISITMFFCGRMMAYFGIILVDTVRFNLASKLKKTCYAKLNEMDYSFYKEKSIGELSTILTTDVYIIHHNMCYVVKQSISLSVTSIFAILYCLYINPILTILTLIPTLFIAIISDRYIKKSNRLYHNERDKLSDLNSFIQENIEGNRLVKNLGMEENEIAKFKEKNKILKDANIEIQKFNINYNTKITFLTYLIELFLVVFGGFFIIKGYASIVDFVIINSFIGRIKKPFIQVSGFLNEWQQFKVAVERVKKLLNAESKIEDNGKIELKKWKSIQFEDVGLQIADKQILKNINLEIEPNKTYAFIGEVGSGKSTIGKLILRLLENSDGSIKIDNKPINDYTIKSIRNNVGYVSQTPFLFSDTIRNNVSFGNDKLSDEDIKYYLKIAEANYVFNLSENLNTIIGENGVSLSGGEKQRLSLARAIAKKPSILVLDDITSALDFETELEVTKNINNLEYKCTKIIIAQKILSVKNADVIYVMQGGKIVETGTHIELLNKNGLYKELFDIQTNMVEEFA